MTLKKPFENIAVKGEKAYYQHFLLFPWNGNHHLRNIHIVVCKNLLCGRVNTFKGLVLQTRKNQGLFGKWLSPLVLYIFTDCRTVKCGRLECEDTFVPEGECCPVCRSKSQNLYKNCKT